MHHGARQPANVFLMENKAMLGDFGIARVLEDSLAVAMTQADPAGPTLRSACQGADGLESSAKAEIACFTCVSVCVRARACVRVPVCAGVRARRVRVCAVQRRKSDGRGSDLPRKCLR